MHLPFRIYSPPPFPLLYLPENTSISTKVTPRFSMLLGFVVLVYMALIMRKQFLVCPYRTPLFSSSFSMILSLSITIYLQAAVTSFSFRTHFLVHTLPASLPSSRFLPLLS